MWTNSVLKETVVREAVEVFWHQNDVSIRQGYKVLTFTHFYSFKLHPPRRPTAVVSDFTVVTRRVSYSGLERRGVSGAGHLHRLLSVSTLEDSVGGRPPRKASTPITAGCQNAITPRLLRYQRTKRYAYKQTCVSFSHSLSFLMSSVSDPRNPYRVACHAGQSWRRCQRTIHLVNRRRRLPAP